MKTRNVLLIGGAGFVGRHLAAALAACGARVTVTTRRRDRARALLALPTVEVVEADLRDPAALARLVAGRDAVINLVGILHSRPGTPYGPDFARAHVELPKRLAAACRAAGVPRLIHVSALGAAAGAPSEYLRSKAAGEAALRESGIAVTILRPSVIFGRDDSFLNLFAGLMRRFPVLPLAGAGARFQPVHVNDVVRVVLEVLDRGEAAGQTYELGGPRAYTLRQLAAFTGRAIGRPRLILDLPDPLAMVQARIMEWLPVKIMSRDNLRSMQVDNVCRAAPLPFGLNPAPLETTAPRWLADDSQRRAYDALRRGAHR